VRRGEVEVKINSDAARMERGRKKVLQMQHGTSEVKFTVRLDESISFRRKTRLVKVVERRCGEGSAQLQQSLRLLGIDAAIKHAHPMAMQE